MMTAEQEQALLIIRLAAAYGFGPAGNHRLLTGTSAHRPSRPGVSHHTCAVPSPRIVTVTPVVKPPAGPGDDRGCALVKPRPRRRF
jgi:hypothetical protein